MPSSFLTIYFMKDKATIVNHKLILDSMSFLLFARIENLLFFIIYCTERPAINDLKSIGFLDNLSYESTMKGHAIDGLILINLFLLIMQEILYIVMITKSLSILPLIPMSSLFVCLFFLLQL